ncbi:hypothetical protein KTR9_4933 (plasmid) [Gordonia sp. KTR9]|nr:hypothetical protein KTR9_4933 [Gordonia sp. KTR9]
MCAHISPPSRRWPGAACGRSVAGWPRWRPEGSLSAATNAWSSTWDEVIGPWSGGSRWSADDPLTICHPHDRGGMCTHSSPRLNPHPCRPGGVRVRLFTAGGTHCDRELAAARQFISAISDCYTVSSALDTGCPRRSVSSRPSV